MPSDATITLTESAPEQPTVMVFWSGGAIGRTVAPGTSLVVGRDAGCDIVVADPSLSRAHVRVECVSAGEFLAEDLGSSNGTFVGDERLAPRRPVPVASGRELRAGGARLFLFSPRAAVPREAAGLGAPEKTELAAIHPFAGRIARGDISVLILGETGVGKDVVAELLHRESKRAAFPLLRLNCAAVPDGLIESELFGHERGAFTGATAAKVGLLEAAEGGSVFLDEVGDLSSAAQSKLLRALENREVLRVGSTTPRTVDVRFIAATSRNLEASIARGTFRADVYYRLSGAVLRIPPLRERRGEILALGRRFLAEACARLGREPPRMTPAAEALLVEHSWPGNVRELKNVMDRASLLCDEGELEPAHLDLDPASMAVSAPLSIPPSFSAGTLPPHADAPSSSATSAAAMEKGKILQALEKCGGNQTRAAVLLGMSRRTLVKRLDAYQITRPKKG